MPAQGSAAPGVSIPIGTSDKGGQSDKVSGGDNLEDWSHQVRQDLLNLAWNAQKNQQTTHLTGTGSLSVPLAGQARFYGTPSLGFAINGSSYWTITGTRNGQPSNTGHTINGSQVPITAYAELFLGEFTVGQGDQLAVTLTSTGSPSALVITNFSVRCELTQRSNKYG
jgi:hypothetical protein